MNYINIDNGGGLQFALDNYRCDCRESCLLNLSWIGPVRLYQPNHVTDGVLLCLGVKREYWEDIFKRVNTVKKHFPFSKGTLSFAKGKMLGAGRHPTGPDWGE